MIQLNIKNLAIMKKEFKKGNNYMLSECPKNGTKYFSIIEKIIQRQGKLYICRKKYNCKNHICDGRNCMQDMNWTDWHFYILTKEEASPYLKAMIATSLNPESKLGYNEL